MKIKSTHRLRVTGEERKALLSLLTGVTKQMLVDAKVRESHQQLLINMAGKLKQEG